MAKKLFLLLGSFLLLFSLSACSWFTSSPPPSDIAPAFSSVNGSFEFDWGDINIAGGTVEHTFTLKNEGASEILLKGASTSCMCTTASIKLPNGTESPSFGMNNPSNTWSYPVKPGESFTVLVVFDPMAHGPTATGPIKRTIDVISDPDPSDGAVQYTRLQTSGDVLSEADYLLKHPAGSDSMSDGEEEDEDHDDEEYADMEAYEVSDETLLKRIQGKEDFVLIDVRENAELEETGVIEGALHIALGSLSQNALSDLGISKSDEIVVYCHSGNRSRQAYELLNVLGYTDVKSLHGGIVHWMEENRPVVPWMMKSADEMIRAPENSAALSSGARILFDRETEDLGIVGLTEIKKTVFTISNVGTEPLIIGTISTSCSCTSAEIASKSIEPGSSTTLTVTFDPTVHEEPKERFKRTVFLETNDPGTPEAEVTIWVDIDEGE
ncbi:MAG: DUF1573 domain-containing protein [bacterium]|nr:DUF1573 domain-containing protein [bacterium]